MLQLLLKFLSLRIGNNLNWGWGEKKKYTEYVFPKISSPCVALRAVTPVMTRWFEISLLCTYSLHHILRSSFWGNLTESTSIFTVPMKIINFWQVSRKEVLMGNYLRNIICFHMPVSTYFHNCLSWSSMETFQTNSEIRSINMGHKRNHCVLNANLTSYQKGVYCWETKYTLLFNWIFKY